MAETLRGTDIVIRALEQQGATRVFTLSGNHIMSLFDAALGRPIDLVQVRHEAAAVHMADAWGRLTGEPGLAMVTAVRPRQCSGRSIHRARRREPDGAAVRSRRHLGARPRRLSGTRPGGDGGAVTKASWMARSTATLAET
jgi:acetolactate synthase-1/2/3 large subunit